MITEQEITDLKTTIATTDLPDGDNGQITPDKERAAHNRVIDFFKAKLAAYLPLQNPTGNAVSFGPNGYLDLMETYFEMQQSTGSDTAILEGRVDYLIDNVEPAVLARLGAGRWVDPEYYTARVNVLAAESGPVIQLLLSKLINSIPVNTVFEFRHDGKLYVNGVEFAGGGTGSGSTGMGYVAPEQYTSDAPVNDAIAAANTGGKTCLFSTGSYPVTSNVTIQGRAVLQNGATLQPAAGVTVTLGAGAIIEATGVWQDTSAGGTFVVNGGAIEKRLTTKTTVPTVGFSENVGSPANSLHETSGTTFVRGGTPTYPHVVGASSELCVIGGGYDNHIGANAIASTMAGGAHHRISEGSSHAAILGGSYQTVNADYGIAVAGTENTVESTYSFVGGGQGNKAGLTGAASPIDYRSAFVGAGASNSAEALRSAIVGGLANKVTSVASEGFIGGGKNNTVSGEGAVVVGGSQNTASGSSSTVFGGIVNVASGTGSMACGSSSTASGNYAVALGDFVLASGSGSQATGSRSNAYLRGQRAHAAGYFAARGDAQLSDLVARFQTTNAAAADLDLFGGTSNKIILPDNTTWLFTAFIVARRSDVDGENAAYKVEGVIKRDTGAATTAFIGTPTITTLAAATNAATWSVTTGVDTTNGALRLTVTGQETKTIRWVARVQLTEVSG